MADTRFQEFIRACANGDIKTIRKLFDFSYLGKTVLEKLDEETGKTGFMIACENGNYRVVSYMIDLIFVTPHQTSRDGKTALELTETAFSARKASLDEGKKAEYINVIKILNEKKIERNQELASRANAARQAARDLKALYNEQNEKSQLMAGKLAESGVIVPARARPEEEKKAAADAAGAAGGALRILNKTKATRKSKYRKNRRRNNRRRTNRK
jgi:ankyrin repeat protein